jgi:hypothetical protein
LNLYFTWEREKKSYQKTKGLGVSQKAEKYAHYEKALFMVLKPWHQYPILSTPHILCGFDKSREDKYFFHVLITFMHF